MNSEELWYELRDKNFRDCLLKKYVIDNRNLSYDDEDFNKKIFGYRIHLEKIFELIRKLNKKGKFPPKDLEKSILPNFSFLCQLLIANLKNYDEVQGKNDLSLNDFWELGGLLYKIMNYDKNFAYKNLKICQKRVLNKLILSDSKDFHSDLTISQKLDIMDWACYPILEVTLLQKL